MSNHDHAIPDYVTGGTTYHHDRYGTVHRGSAEHCESCRLQRMRAMSAYSATIPADLRTPTQVVADLNRMLAPRKAKPERVPVWPMFAAVGICAFAAVGVCSVLRSLFG